ncbi:MAG TPA: sigma-70 family RNA polymerase sigma factor [Eoetvoesiella sp.]
MSFESDVVNLLPVLRRYAYALTGDATCADDLVQDTAERALTRWSSWRSHSNLRAWLLAILRNLYIDQLRKQHEISTADDAAAWYTLADPEEKVDGLFLRDIQRALYRLPLEQREVLLLVGLEELSYQEASIILKIPVGTVMSRLSRAREHMHSLMFTEDANPHKRPALKVVRSTP